ncbi:MAG: hypothetical protein ACI90M_003164, partial [Candidatus Azotimanducaceae bacterium]
MNTTRWTKATRSLALALLVVSTVGAQDARDTAAETKSHADMLARLGKIATEAKTIHKYHGDKAAKQLWAQLEQDGDKAGWKLRLDAALAHMRLANTEAAIDILKKASDEMRAGRLKGGLDEASSIVFYLGMAYMRQAETENCCARSTAESCILPLRGEAIHTKTEGATKAIPCFELVVANRPADDYWHLSARWLLNIAHMTLGTWPDGLAEERRMPIDALQSQFKLPHFKNVAAKTGLDMFAMLGGVIVDDFDGDNDLDVL